MADFLIVVLYMVSERTQESEET